MRPYRAFPAAAAVFLIAWSGLTHAAAQATAPDDHYDFGSIAQGTHVSHEFAVRNTGDSSLRFSAAELTMPGMQARFAPAELAPGAEGRVTLDWSTDHVAGAVEGSARIRVNGSERPELSLTMKGSVLPPISIEPMPAVFLSTFAGEPGERVLTIRNNTAQPFALARADAGPHVAATIEPVEPGKVFRVAVRAAPHTATGRYDESLTLATGVAGENITIPVHVWVKPDLYANPDSVDFGTVAREAAQQAGAADMLVQTAIVRRRNGAFHIKSIASDVPMVSVSRSPPDGANESFTVTLRLRPEALFAGARIDGKVRVRTDDPRYPEIVIPVTGNVTSTTGSAATPAGHEHG